MDANRRQGRGKSFSNAGRREPDAGTFFAVSDGKIARVTTYYNLTDWIIQVSA